MIQSKINHIVCISIALTCGAMRAEDVPTGKGPHLSLTDVVRLADDPNPRVLAERETIAAARADRRTAAAFPNPKLAMSHLQPGAGQATLFTGDRQEQVNVEIPIVIPGQRSSRIAKADADIAAARAHFEAGTGLLAGDACVSFTHLLALQEKASVLSNAFTSVSHLKETVAGRASQGAASVYDLARVEVEMEVLGSHLEGTRSEIAAESGQLASLLGLTNGLPIADGALLAWVIPDRMLYDLRTETLGTPLATAAARDRAAAEAAIKSAKRSRWPDLSVGLGRTWTQRPFGSADYFALNVELPIFDTRRGQLDKARSEARAAEARQRSVLIETEATLRQLAQTVERRRAAVNRYQAEIEPRLAKLKQMSDDAYVLGQHTLLESLDAEQARREVTLDQIESVSALIEAEIKFLTATGHLRSYLAANSTENKP